MTEAVKRVYAFGKDANGNNVTEGNTEMKWVLGGKGANLAEMANIGLPVPPGFTITGQTCMEYANAGNVWPEGALDTIAEYRADLEKKMQEAADALVETASTTEPAAALTAKYEARYQNFKKLYPALKGFFAATV